MSTRLREAAIRRLRALGAAAEDGAVRRLSVEVEVGDQLETVILTLRDAELQCVSSDGHNEGPHVTAALRFVAGFEGAEEPLAPGASPSPATETKPRTPNELADALDDLVTAIIRVGVPGAQYAPSVDAALERIIETAPQPTPSGLGRFIGRLQQELRADDPRAVARVLDGASRLVEALRHERPTPDSQQRIDAWLGTRAGSTPEVELVYDRTMVEVGREWLSGTERASIERRYLVDVETGVVYREDRPRHAMASLGPCPRQVRVGLAEIEPGPAPRRVRILQYEVQPYVEGNTWDRLQQVASQSFAEVAETYRRSLRAEPTLCEPFALIKPYRIERKGVFKAFDREGHQLVVDRNARRGAVLAFYDLLAEEVEPAWLAGRLTDMGATLCLTPFALGTREGGYVRL
jgi:hypothetical protein